MENPFQILSQRLSNIELLLLDIKHEPSPKHEPESILTASQAAELLQVSLPTFREWDKRGYVTRRVIAGEIRYLRSELIASLQKPEVKRVTKRKTAKS